MAVHTGNRLLGLNLEPPELQEIKFLLFKATQSILLYFGNLNRLISWPSLGSTKLIFSPSFRLIYLFLASKYIFSLRRVAQLRMVKMVTHGWSLDLFGNKFNRLCRQTSMGWGGKWLRMTAHFWVIRNRKARFS